MGGFLSGCYHKNKKLSQKSKSFNFQAVEQQEQELADWSVRLVNATWVYHTKRVKDTGEAFEININAKKGIWMAPLNEEES